MLMPQLLPSIPVDVMPGETDPANYLMPQQPLNRCLLPVAARCRRRMHRNPRTVNA